MKKKKTAQESWIVCWVSYFCVFVFLFFCFFVRLGTATADCWSTFKSHASLLLRIVVGLLFIGIICVKPDVWSCLRWHITLLGLQCVIWMLTANPQGLSTNGVYFIIWKSNLVQCLLGKTVVALLKSCRRRIKEEYSQDFCLSQLISFTLFSSLCFSLSLDISI